MLNRKGTTENRTLRRDRAYQSRIEDLIKEVSRLPGSTDNRYKVYQLLQMEGYPGS